MCYFIKETASGVIVTSTISKWSLQITIEYSYNAQEISVRLNIVLLTQHTFNTSKSRLARYNVSFRGLYMWLQSIN